MANVGAEAPTHKSSIALAAGLRIAGRIEDQHSCREHAQPRSSRNVSISTISRGRARSATGGFCFLLRPRRWPSCRSHGMAFAGIAGCTPPEACPPRMRFSPSNVPLATNPTWVFMTPRSSTRSASRAMTALCIKRRRHLRPRAHPVTPIIGERFALRPRVTQTARNVTRPWRRAGVPAFLSATSGVLKGIIPNSPCCDPEAATPEPFSSTITSTCSRIFSGRMAAACKWFAPTATARRRTPAVHGPMEIQVARREHRRIHRRIAQKKS